MSSGPVRNSSYVRTLPSVGVEDWKAPPATLELPEREVHLWRIAADDGRRPHPRYWIWLSPDEVRRAERLLRERDRNRFVYFHGSARSILALYLKLRPEQVDWRGAMHAKPFLQQRKLEFNLAHCDHLAVLAVSLRQPLGVDVERIREMDESVRIAERVFCPSDRAQLAEVAPDRLAEVFFQIWTRTEARLKAEGVGIGALERPGWLENAGLWQPTKPECGWHLHDFAPIPNYCGALAVECGHSDELRMKHWSYCHELDS